MRRRLATSRRTAATRRSARNRARSSGTRRCGSGTSAPSKPQATRLPGVLGRADLADHGDLDLTRVLQLFLDLLRDIARDHRRRQVVNRLGLHEDPDLASRLHRVHLLDPRERVADLFESLESLDVGLERLATRARAPAADAVGDLREQRVDRPLLHLAVVRFDAMYDLRILLHPTGDLRPDDRM